MVWEVKESFLVKADRSWCRVCLQDGSGCGRARSGVSSRVLAATELHRLRYLQVKGTIQASFFPAPGLAQCLARHVLE